MLDQGYINHIALVLDASASMSRHSAQLIKVADNQIAYLAQRSKELDQETRITVYTFNDSVECVVYDKDVLRLPSISKAYKTAGMTALIDATVQSQKDLSHTAELYGDHAFLTYVLTDGMENRSRKYGVPQLTGLLKGQPDHWTLAVMVPDQRSVFEAKKFGFSPNNIAVWDASSSAGIEEAGATIRRTTDNFMSQRSSGVRGTKNIFDMSSNSLNVKTVKSALQELPKGSYHVLGIFNDSSLVIQDFVMRHGIRYHLGIAYYQLSKAETIQAHKKICVRNKKTGKVYSGQEARDVLGLPALNIRVRPQDNPEFEVFIQSTSVNRKLVPGTKLLVMP